MQQLGKRNVLLIMDNAPTHQLADLHLSNTTVEFFPANVTSVVQPMDAGIIRAVKQRYRTKFIKHKIAAYDMGKPKSKLNMREVVMYIA